MSQRLFAVDTVCCVVSLHKHLYLLCSVHYSELCILSYAL